MYKSVITVAVFTVFAMFSLVASALPVGVSEALAASVSLLIELLFSSTGYVRIHWEKGCYRSGNPQQSRFVPNQRFAQTSKLKVA